MATYQEIRRQVEDLTPDEQLRLLEDLATIVRKQRQGQPKRSIMELEGLGKEIWRGFDAQAYITTERDSWNG
jgi:DNA-binding HxlR family transcriptional regulator